MKNWLGVATVVTLLAIISGCSEPSSSTTPVTEVAALDEEVPLPPSEGEEIETPPVFDPDGTADDNLAFFESVLVAAGAGSGITSSDAPIDSLVDAGFSAEFITHTQDATARQFPVDSISIAVEFDGECLIGQYSTTWISTAVSALLPSGDCLIGVVTRAG
mgnify:CR=1 FL=1